MSIKIYEDKSKIPSLPEAFGVGSAFGGIAGGAYHLNRASALGSVHETLRYIRNNPQKFSKAFAKSALVGGLLTAGLASIRQRAGYY